MIVYVATFLVEQEQIRLRPSYSQSKRLMTAGAKTLIRATPLFEERINRLSRLLVRFRDSF